MIIGKWIVRYLLAGVEINISVKWIILQLGAIICFLSDPLNHSSFSTTFPHQSLQPPYKLFHTSINPTLFFPINPDQQLSHLTLIPLAQSHHVLQQHAKHPLTILSKMF
jgi:hypothetical protein